MGFLKRFGTRSDKRSSLDLRNTTGRTPDVPKSIQSPAPIPYSPPPPPPPYEREEDHEISVSDLGSLLVGIDFGTTYSGVAWAYSKQPEDVNIITNWDSIEFASADKGKAPTKISYGNGYEQMTWGYGVADNEAVEWFKLLLLDDADMDPKQRRSPQITKAKQLLQNAGKTPVQAVADYLRLLWKHAVMNIKRSFGEATVEGLPIRVVCTVPAVWTTNAVSRMREAAQESGILDYRPAGETTLDFVSEPEAAALATFDDLKTRPNFRQGDCFVVCDAGGGTVDLISYKVVATKPLKLIECVEGSGKLCGAVFLDQEFEGLMKQVLGDAWDIPDAIRKSFMSSQWENGVKRGFEGQDKNWKITLPHECVERGAPYHLDLNQGHVRQIFEEVISQIRVLVNEQIDAIEEKEGKLPKAVVLVGGFGSCRYLYNLLSLENKHRGMEVYQSPGTKPWTAICRGAVFKALTNSSLPGTMVQSRISRCNYGTCYNTDFDPSKHMECDQYIDRISGLAKASNQLRWYLKRGDNIDEAKPVRLSWHINASTEKYRNHYPLSASIFTCNDRVPPTRLISTVRPGPSIRSEKPVDISNLRSFKGVDGKYYKKIDFSIEMTVIGTALEFALMYQGKHIGHSSVKAQIDL